MARHASPFARARVTSAVLALTVMLASSSAWAPPPGSTEIDPLRIEILRLDPDPSVANQPFDIVVRAVNRSTGEIAAKIRHDTAAIPEAMSLTLAGGETRVVEIRGRIPLAGEHEVRVEIDWLVGRVRRVLPNGRIVWTDRYQKSGSDTKPMRVTESAFVPGAFVDLGREGTDGRQFSGVVQTLAGTRDMTFAIPKTGGVWRSVNRGAWTYLRESPPRAFSIAVEPRNTQHIAVGERDDDAAVNRLGRSGLWESTDAGNTWTYTFDPTSLPVFAGAPTHQAIPAVAFAHATSTLLVATDHGIARRVQSQTANPFSNAFTFGRPTAACGLPDVGPVTALVTSARRAWAQSRTHVFWSDDDGVTWDCREMPTRVSVGPDADLIADYNTTSTGGNDNAALGAFDDRAYLVFKVWVPNTDPRAKNDSECQKDATRTLCEPNTISPLMTFFPARTGAAAWVTQYTGDGDGRGGNGRRFVNTLEVDPIACPSLAERSVGRGLQLAYGAGQSVQQALSTGTDDRVVFDRAIRTNGSDAAGGVATGIHADVWNFFVPMNYCPNGRGEVLYATDGGVDMGVPSPDEPGRWSSATWQRHSAGLHVQTAQNLLVVSGTTVPPPSSPLPKLPIRHVAYPTQDNQSSWRNEDGSWTEVAAGGDVNWVAGDVAQPAAILWRTLQIATLHRAGSDPESIELSRIADATKSLDGPTRVSAIQTLASETVEDGALDMVMLVDLPLQLKDGTQAGGALGGTARRALLRNTRFDEHPNGPASNYEGWTVVADDLPADTRRFWVSGGHANPTFFVYSGAGNTACADGLHVRERQPRGVDAWRCLVSGLVEFSVANDGVPQNGPAFVNPFDPNVILVTGSATAGGTPVLRLSIDRGANFCDLPGLTALVTESGRYDVVGKFNPGVAFDWVGSRFHGYQLAVPSAVGFDRRAPGTIAVASPYTGIYYGQLAKQGQTRATGSCRDADWREPEWRDLAPRQPRARAYVTGLAAVGGGVVASTAGMSTYAIESARSSLPATYFVPAQSGNASSPIARLVRADGAPSPWSRVWVTARTWDGDALQANNVQVRTNAAGEIVLPAGVPPGTYVLSLSFRGNGADSPSAAKFRYDVTP